MRTALAAIAAMVPLIVPGGAGAQAPGGDAPQIFSIRDGKPRITLGDGPVRTTIEPILRVDLDAGGFWDQELAPSGRPPRLHPGANVRRARLGVQGTMFRDIAYSFVWDFAPAAPQEQAEGGRIFELQAGYTGLDWITFRVGAFTLIHTIDYSMSSFELLMLERPAITNIVASLASGDTRLAAGVEARGQRWLAAGYVSDGVLSTLHDDRQRAVVGRAAWLAVDGGGVQLQVGINGLAQFRPGPNANESVRLRDYPELRLDPTRLLDTRAIAANEAWSLGPELSGRIGPVYLQAEYYHIGVDPKSGGGRGFDGWYVAASVPLIGEPRTRSRTRAAWGRPRFDALNPAAGNWGWLELAGRFSTVDLNDGPVRGGRQSIWAAALNWYPLRQLRLTAQYMNGTIALDGPDRDFQAIAFRASLNL